jgi:hypothetical protein
VFEFLLIVIICFGSLYNENRLVNSSLNLRNHFNNPSIVEEPGYLDALTRGLATQSSQKLDLRFSEDVSQDRLIFDSSMQQQCLVDIQPVVFERCLRLRCVQSGHSERSRPRPSHLQRVSHAVRPPKSQHF